MPLCFASHGYSAGEHCSNRTSTPDQLKTKGKPAGVVEQRPIRDGVAWRDGKLYVFSRLQGVLVTTGWPMLRAWRRTPKGRGGWSCCRPQINLGSQPRVEVAPRRSAPLWASTQAASEGWDAIGKDVAGCCTDLPVIGEQDLRSALVAVAFAKSGAPGVQEVGQNEVAKRLLSKYPQSGRLTSGIIDECVSRYRGWLTSEVKQRQALESWAATFPSNVRQALLPFGSRLWSLARLARTDPGLELIQTNSALAFCVSNNWVFRPNTHPARTALRLLRLRRRDAAGWLGFPATESSVRLLGKLAPLSCHVPLLLTLRRLMAPGALSPDLLSTLRGLGPISLDVAVALHSPTLMERHMTPTLLRDIAHHSVAGGPIGEWYRDLRDAWRMQRALEHPPQPLPLHSLGGLQQMHDRVAREYQERVGQDAEAVDLDSPIPAPPYRGTKHIQALTDPKAILEEGALMDHCVLSYLPAVRAGDSALYKVEFQGERCTLELAEGRLGWTLGQLRGRANARVTPETRTEVERWFATARNASASPTSWMPQLAHEDESEAYPPDELQGIFPL